MQGRIVLNPLRSNMGDAQVAGTHWIYQRIRAYCDRRTGDIGGYYGQESYKGDFFAIFVDAFYAALCGRRAVLKYNRRAANLKRKSLPFAEHVVSGEGIRGALERDWPGGKRTRDSQRMVERLCDWWDSWVYAWDRYPGALLSPRKRVAKINA